MARARVAARRRSAIFTLQTSKQPIANTVRQARLAHCPLGPKSRQPCGAAPHPRRRAQRPGLPPPLPNRRRLRTRAARRRTSSWTTSGGLRETCFLPCSARVVRAKRFQVGFVEFDAWRHRRRNGQFLVAGGDRLQTGLWPGFLSGCLCGRPLAPPPEQVRIPAGGLRASPSPAAPCPLGAEPTRPEAYSRGQGSRIRTPCPFRATSARAPIRPGPDLSDDRRDRIADRQQGFDRLGGPEFCQRTGRCAPDFSRTLDVVSVAREDRPGRLQVRVETIAWQAAGRHQFRGVRAS